jgi:hypothetical protein
MRHSGRAATGNDGRSLGWAAGEDSEELVLVLVWSDGGELMATGGRARWVEHRGGHRTCKWQCCSVP